ncbi:hypothetical protein [Haloarcula argentinensis]|uniref:Uncharacterized protein n=1 Tax=Haloarcula argentinensis TaxID=43776 RepID=A0A847U859_HALAR|nr:hypothetical protein [Haloarcula argentinensis]NLV14462.1 hypothetical protein [Haloarcula argentinensis]
MTASGRAQDMPLADGTAMLDSGANAPVTCTTTAGEQYLREGRELFQRFRVMTREPPKCSLNCPTDESFRHQGRQSLPDDYAKADTIADDSDKYPKLPDAAVTPEEHYLLPC